MLQSMGALQAQSPCRERLQACSLRMTQTFAMLRRLWQDLASQVSFILYYQEKYRAADRHPVHAQSPPDTSAHVLSHASPSSSEHPHNLSSDQEPLLYLVTEAHPWFGKTIQGSLAAYATTKGYAPRFVQAGANIVERSIASPIVSTVGNVSRMTGVDSAARWYYARPAGDMERNDEEANRGKRRRVMDEEELMRMRPGPLSPRSAMRRDSEDSRAESLPSYRASKPPSYREEASPATTDRSRQHERPPHNRSWSRQLTTSVAGLGVAMSDRSRHSLVYCLGILSRNSEHIRTVTAALKMVLEQYDQARDQWHQERASETEKGERPRTPDHDEAARRLAEIIKRHCDDIWQTLKNVVHSVSVTVGGALPGNARNFVRNQLMSLPERWQMVSTQTMGESETSRAANRMIAFAQEGLDMINNVNSACQVTLDSAESWANTFGRRPVEAAPNGYTDHDHKMEDGEDEMSHSQHAEKQ